jgi:hypothetical protein
VAVVGRATVVRVVKVVVAVRAAVLKMLTTAAWSGRPSLPPAVDQSRSRSPSIRLTNLA